MKSLFLVVILTTVSARAAQYRCHGYWKGLNFDLKISHDQSIIRFDKNIVGTYLNTLRGKSFSLSYDQKHQDYVNYGAEVKVSEKHEDYQSLRLAFKESGIQNVALRVDLEVSDVRWQNANGWTTTVYQADCKLLP